MKSDENLMPQFKFKVRNKKALQRLNQAFEETQILQRQQSLIHGRWDFVVFGPVSKSETILRVGFAEHATIHRAPAYIASLAEPGWTNLSGVPIEEFMPDEVPQEYQGLEIIQVDPLRPLVITEKRTLGTGSRVIDRIRREFEEQNIALIHSPHETDWVISVVKYLNECDKAFPDKIQEDFSVLRGSRHSGFIPFGSSGSSTLIN